jgi:hypothetical protein
MTPEVWDGIRLRHSTVESSGQPTEAARAMAYLSHLDRADLMREVERLRAALQVIAEGTLCPELFPDLDVEKDEWELAAKTAEVSAIAALEPRT